MVRQYDQSVKGLSCQLRINMTEAEQKLWYYIRRKQICNVQFYRQKPLLNYILDFYAPSVSLAIELDGGQHFEEMTREKDILRTKKLAETELHILRFNNTDIFQNIEGVLQKIHTVVKGKLVLSKSPLTPLF